MGTATRSRRGSSQARTQLAGRFVTEFFGPGGTCYNTIGNGPCGRVGVGNIDHETGRSSSFRIRVEPSSEKVSARVGEILGEGWKQPEGDNLRYSTIVFDDAELLDNTLELALRAVQQDEPEPVTILTVLEQCSNLPGIISASRIAVAENIRAVMSGQVSEIPERLGVAQNTADTAFAALEEALQQIDTNLQTVAQNFCIHVLGAEVDSVGDEDGWDDDEG
jgi:hypothetical protein